MACLACGSAPAAGAADAQGDGAADHHAGVGALDLDETRTIGCAGVDGAGSLQREQLAPTLPNCPASECEAARPRRRRPAASQRGSQEGFFASGLLSRGGALGYRTNLTPSDLPRRQTTSQFRPVRASRENASRSLPGNTLGSSTVILAPEVDISCTTQGRAAKPPSRVIQPDCCSDLRASRFLVASGHLRYSDDQRYPYPGQALETVDTRARIRAFR